MSKDLQVALGLIIGVVIVFFIHQQRMRWAARRQSKNLNERGGTL